MNADFVLCLRAGVDAPADARSAIAGWSWFLSYDEQADLTLGLSELVTNSARHGPVAGRIDVRVARGPAGVRVEVQDEGTGAPVTQRVPDAAGGRGLHIVEALSAEWGVEAAPRRVWFTLRTAPVPDRPSPRA